MEFSSGFLCNSFVEQKTKAFVSLNDKDSKTDICCTCYLFKTTCNTNQGKKLQKHISVVKRKPHAKSQLVLSTSALSKTIVLAIRQGF